MALTQVQPGMLGATQPYNFKNRIINGAMTIAQYSTSSQTATGYATVDRWAYYSGGISGKFNWQQNAGSVTTPVGFSNYLGFTSTSAYSVGSAEKFILQQSIEGFNTSDLMFGTANAKTVTLSAWVYSSLTGTFGGSLQNYASTRSYPFSYSIPVANTWTQISITIAGDTGGTWVGASNAASFAVIFSLGAGSTLSGTAGSWSGSNYVSATGATSVVGTSGATFYITGVQLELGVTATSFDYRAYGQELALCQRYYTKLGVGTSSAGIGVGVTSLTTTAQVVVALPVTMRASPTSTVSNMAITDWQTYTTTVTPIAYQFACPTSVLLTFSSSGFTAYRPALFVQATSAGYTDFSAEL